MHSNAAARVPARLRSRAFLAGMTTLVAAAALVTVATSPAAAAPTEPITITIAGLSGPIANDGASGTTGTITVKNTSGADVNLSNAANSFAVITRLSATGLTGAMVTNPGSTVTNGALAAAPSWATASCPANSVCDQTAPVGVNPVPADHFPAAYDNGGAPFAITLDTRVPATPAGITGALTARVSLVEVTPGGALVATFGTGDATVVLAAPGAASTSTPPKATLYQPYSHQLTNLGVPAATSAQIKVYKDSGAGPVALPNAATYTLNNALVFDTATGRITRPLTATDSPNPAPDRYTVVINNGYGGAGAPVAATATRPALVAHDVMVQFTIPVLFSDVAATHPFSSEIYRMAAAGITKGNADGTFRPGSDVSRQAFAAFAIKYLTASGVSVVPFELTSPLKTGSCTAHGTTSAFVDVADTNQFCMEIKQLAIIGVTTGYDNEFTFEPTRNISRQAISAMMYRLHLVASGFTDPAQISAPKPCTGASGFSDVSTANPFCGQIQWMKDEAISTGYAGGKYKPSATSTRQATVAFVDRLGAIDGIPGFGS